MSRNQQTACQADQHNTPLSPRYDGTGAARFRHRSNVVLVVLSVARIAPRHPCADGFMLRA